MTIHQSTRRLVGRPIRADDLSLLRLLHENRRVMATLSADGCPHPAERSALLLERYLRHWSEHDFGLWMFHEQASGQFVGYSGLQRTWIADCDEVELAYAVRAADWGRGFAEEMGRAALETAFRRLELESVVCYTLPTNFGSLNVMRKLGFEFESDVVHAGLPHVMFRLAGCPHWLDPSRPVLSDPA